VARVAPEATAYAYREAPFVANINARWTDAADSARHIAWTRDLWAAFQASSAGGTYVNFMGDEGQDRVRSAYGPGAYERLVALKRRYDPTNLFRLNHNIDPGG
jgi:FAD/FMN-containing dehydrogenase